MSDLQDAVTLANDAELATAISAALPKIKLCPRCKLKPKIAGGYCIDCKRSYQNAWKRDHPEVAYRNDPPSGTALSRREHQVVELLAQGLNYPKAAKKLHLSHSAIAQYASRAMTRVGVTGLFQLGMWAQKNGYGVHAAPVFCEDQCDCGPNCDGRKCSIQVNA